MHRKLCTLAGSILVSGALGITPAAAFEVGLELVAEGLTAPVAVATPGDGTGRLFVLEQTGQIRTVTAAGELLEAPFADFQKKLDELEPLFDERGALGLAFHPDYAANGRFYVYYSAPLRADHELTEPVWGSHTSHLVEMRVSDSDPNRADPTFERVLMQIDELQFAHNGGALTFGPDGFLYVALGDGGGAPEDVDYPDEGTSQLPDTLLGKILRLDVEGANGLPYGIPPDNPFVDQPGYLPEIYALGFRNPFRISFDAKDGTALYVGDVGQNSYEEIDLVEAGGNYGWPIKEATHCFEWSDFEGHHDRCVDDGLIDPIIEYKNGGKHPDESEGRATIGGYVYRGSAVPKLEGKLIFGDWGREGGEPSGVVYVGTPSAPGESWHYEPLAFAGAPFQHYILAFGEDADHELYLLTTDNTGPDGTSGKIYKIAPAS